MTQEIDLVEEVGRLNGFDHIRALMPCLPLTARILTDMRPHCRSLLVARGYHEAITYSFIDADSEAWFAEGEPIALINPISVDLSVMRPSLLPGLLQAVNYNLNRQQSSGRMFEIGRRFVGTHEPLMIAGVIFGEEDPYHWQGSLSNDFYALKGDITALLQVLGLSNVTFEANNLPAYVHPGQALNIVSNGKPIGILGKLHPATQKGMDLKIPCFVFELELPEASQKKRALYRPISKFPGIRRDLAMEVDRALPVEALLNTVYKEAGDILVETNVFDVYTGDQIEKSKKSVAIYLILQALSHTLKDEEIEGVMNRVISQLKQTHGAILRE